MVTEQTPLSEELAVYLFVRNTLYLYAYAEHSNIEAIFTKR